MTTEMQSQYFKEIEEIGRGKEEMAKYMARYYETLQKIAESGLMEIEQVNNDQDGAYFAF
jgi:flagellar motor component MotA